MIELEIFFNQVKSVSGLNEVITNLDHSTEETIFNYGGMNGEYYFVPTGKVAKYLCDKKFDYTSMSGEEFINQFI